MPVTLEDVAAKAGASITTVSFVLRGKTKQARISDQLSQRILTAARELGYRRDEYAAAMITGKANASGFLILDDLNEFNSRILNGILSAAGKHDHLIKIVNVPHNTSPDEIAGICARQRFVSLITYNDIQLSVRLAERLVRHNIQTIAIGAFGKTHETETPSDIPVIKTDNRTGGRLAFEHFYSLGHRRFCVVTLRDKRKWAYERLQGFLDAARDAGTPVPTENILSFDRMVTELSETEIPPEFPVSYFQGKNGATALFTYNDYTALNIMMRLQRAGVRTPEDVSVIGYGDSFFTPHSYPGITTLRESFDEMGALCVRLIVKARDNKFVSGAEECRLIPPRLTARASTSAPRTHFIPKLNSYNS
jgi:LacI family transcriptional regulator